MWVSVEGQSIVGCLLIGVASLSRTDRNYLRINGGKFHFETMMPALEDYYRKQGAKFVEIPGRKGWQRRFGNMGYKVKSVTIVKEL